MAVAITVAILTLLSYLVDRGHAFTNSTDTYALLMPNVRPLAPETYLCTTVKLDEDQTYYILGFKPNASAHTAHHILIYGCLTPGRKDEVWDCGEMQGSSSQYKKGQVCGSGSQIVYAWAHNARQLELPADTGIKVGRDSAVKYLVLQVHYLDVTKFIDGGTDNSGVILTYTELPMPKLASVILLGTNGFINAKSTEHMETACEITEDIEIHPLAFRPHTHSLGTVVSGYKVSHVGKKHDKWTLLGKQNPQLPQMFYPVDDSSVVIRKGDILAARCTMVNDRDRITRIGPTSADEMCNFYLLYWVEGPKTLEQKFCFSWGPPMWYWKHFPLHNIPDKDASRLKEM
uniref:peptidylglycine monooxygenase n=1 Tax=Hemiscolopendra marginata TaxID=943146 RepID=A0A646QG22_9MYRI